MSGRWPFFAAVLAAFGFSWLVLVKVPVDQAASLVPGREELRDGNIVKVPASFPGREAARAYAEKGCFVCHVRATDPRRVAQGEGREWGKPVSAAGFSRMGPDLTGLAARRSRDELILFLRGHGGEDDAEQIADWLLAPPPVKGGPKP